MKPLTWQDIYISSWKDIPPRDTFLIHQILQKHKIMIRKENFEAAGYMTMKILELLIRHGKKTLHRKLTSEQKLDIFLDMNFLHDGWKSFPVKEITCQGKTLTAPQDNLQDITFENFKYMDAAFSKVAVLLHHREEEKAESCLDEMLATIYLPGRSFHRDLIPEHGPHLRKAMKPYERSLTLLTYGYIRNGILKRCPALFGNQGEDDENRKEQAPIYTGQLWLNLHYDLAETEAFKGFQSSGQSNIYDVLDYLERTAKMNLKKTTT